MAGAVLAMTHGAEMSGVQASMLREAMQSQAQMQQQLLSSMLHANPPGVGGSVNTWA